MNEHGRLEAVQSLLHDRPVLGTWWARVHLTFHDMPGIGEVFHGQKAAVAITDRQIVWATAPGSWLSRQQVMKHSEFLTGIFEVTRPHEADVGVAFVSISTVNNQNFIPVPVGCMGAMRFVTPSIEDSRTLANTLVMAAKAAHKQEDWQAAALEQTRTAWRFDQCSPLYDYVAGYMRHAGIRPDLVPQ